MKLRKFSALLLSLLMLMSLAACGGSGAESGGQSGSNDQNEITEFVSPFAVAKKGETIRGFSIDLLSGETFKLSDYAGKAILVNFWATWCGPCVGEMPDFQRLQEDYADKLAVLAINCAENEATVKAFLEETGYTFPVALDQTGVWGGFLTGIPYTIVIGPDGVVAETKIGSGPDMYAYYAEIVEGLF